MTINPTALVAMLDSTSPLKYSVTDSGVENRFRKLRDHTSSKKTIVTPCMTRTRKSHSRIAPSNENTRSKPGAAMLFK
jgi:hypothetical protein